MRQSSMLTVCIWRSTSGNRRKRASATRKNRFALGLLLGWFSHSLVCLQKKAQPKADAKSKAKSAAPKAARAAAGADDAEPHEDEVKVRIASKPRAVQTPRGTQRKRLANGKAKGKTKAKAKGKRNADDRDRDADRDETEADANGADKGETESDAGSESDLDIGDIIEMDERPEGGPLNDEQMQEELAARLQVCAPTHGVVFLFCRCLRVL